MNRLEKLSKLIFIILTETCTHFGLCSIAINGSDLLEETIP